MMRKCFEDCEMFNKYLIISYNKHRNTGMNEADLLRIFFKANDSALRRWNMFCFFTPLAMGSPSVSYWEKKQRLKPS